MAPLPNIQPGTRTSPLTAQPPIPDSHETKLAPGERRSFTAQPDRVDLSLDSQLHSHAGSDQFLLKREHLQWARGLIDSCLFGVREAGALVERASAIWQSGDPAGSAEQLGEIGEGLRRIGDLTAFRGLYPLRENGSVTLPALETRTVALYNNQPDSLVSPSSLDPGAQPGQASASLSESHDALWALHETLIGQRDQIEQAHYELASTEHAQRAHKTDVETLKSPSLDDVSTLHWPPSAARAVELLIPDMLGPSRPIS